MSLLNNRTSKKLRTNLNRVQVWLIVLRTLDHFQLSCYFQSFYWKCCSVLLHLCLHIVHAVLKQRSSNLIFIFWEADDVTVSQIRGRAQVTSYYFHVLAQDGKAEAISSEC